MSAMFYDIKDDVTLEIVELNGAIYLQLNGITKSNRAIQLDKSQILRLIEKLQKVIK